MALTQVDGGLLSPTNAQYTGFKNRIINGNMGIWQRGTTGTAAAYAYPSVDRWAGGPFSLYQVLSQSSSVPTGVAQYSLKVQRTAAQTNTGAVLAMQTIESNNCYDLSGQSVTLSFWAKAGANFSAAGSNIVVSVVTGTTADQGGNTYYTWTGGASPISSVQAITTTWTKYTFTGTCGAGVQEAAVVIYFTPVGTAGADDAFYITGVQLEKGSTATSFDYRPYGTELALCQRYYQQISFGVDGANVATGFNSTSAVGSYNFLTQMRAPATVAFVGTVTANLPGLGGITFTSPSGNGYTKNAAFSFAGGSSLSVGYPAQINGGTATFSAEL